MNAGLIAKDMSVSFGGVRALKGVDIRVPAGEVVGLIGRNGSGKSTLFNCISGFVRPGGGRAFVDGVEITGLPPQRIVAAGVARTFQTPRVDPRASVLEAVMCGLFASMKTSLIEALLGSPRAAREESAARVRAEAEIARLGLADISNQEMGALSLGLVRLVDVARCLASGARYILLDEPAAGLTPAEQERLAREVRAVAVGGVGVLLVEHNIDLVRSVCGSIVVLDAGEIICEGVPEDVLRNDSVMRTYLGALGAGQAELGDAA